jgi:hypothetical protein
MHRLAVGSVLGQGKGAGVSVVLLHSFIAMLSKPGALADLRSKFQSAGSATSCSHGSLGKLLG